MNTIWIHIVASQNCVAGVFPLIKVTYLVQLLAVPTTIISASGLHFHLTYKISTRIKLNGCPFCNLSRVGMYDSKSSVSFQCH